MKAVVVLGSALLLGFAQAVTLEGAGASFPAPLYAKMFAEYQKAGGVTVNYRRLGSGEGQELALARSVDFGASDVPLKDDVMKRENGGMLHVPVALGAVVIAYNLRGLEDKLNFNGQTLAQIFLGTVKRWNDPALAKLNPGVDLPDLPITVVTRSDASGTTAVFTDYLGKINAEFHRRVGTGLDVEWPVGAGFEGNDKVAQAINTVPGAIGYTELTFALRAQLPFAGVQNRSGRFVRPTTASVTAAASAFTMPDDNRVSITYSPDPDGYPISAYTYLLVPAEQGYGNRNLDQARALRNLLNWMVHDGQKYNVALQYGALPPEAAEQAAGILRKLTYKGQPIK